MNSSGQTHSLLTELMAIKWVTESLVKIGMTRLDRIPHSLHVFLSTCASLGTSSILEKTTGSRLYTSLSYAHGLIDAGSWTPIGTGEVWSE
jgi:hypothetical protein